MCKFDTLPKQSILTDQTKRENSIEEYRHTIDEETKAIIEALEKRFFSVDKIGQLKEDNNLPVSNKEREELILSMAEKSLYEVEIKRILKEIIYVSKLREMMKKTGCGLLGKALAHSFSPALHRMICEKTDLNYSYELFELREEDLERFIKEGNYQGLNVTVPYKEKVMAYLDEISFEAQQIGAVNTILKRDGKLIGYNTDYAGLMEAVSEWGIDVKGRKCLCLGTGGAAKAAEFALNKLGADSVHLISARNQDWRKFKETEYIFNATPVGMGKDYINIPLKDEEGNNETLWYDEFPKLKGIFDLIYNPDRTRLMLEAEKRGIKTVNGLTMLVKQGILSAEIFSGKNIEHKAGLLCDIKREICKKRNIVLIGMPAVGKTTIGKLVSGRLNMSFLDIDEQVIKKEGMDIPSIFEKYGEEYFRKAETQAVIQASQGENIVISCGGGTVENIENYFELARNGIVVFLDGEPKEKNMEETRPLLKKQSWNDLRKERFNRYIERSDISLDIRNRNAKEAADMLIDSIQKK